MQQRGRAHAFPLAEHCAHRGLLGGPRLQLRARRGELGALRGERGVVVALGKRRGVRVVALGQRCGVLGVLGQRGCEGGVAHGQRGGMHGRVCGTGLDRCGVHDPTQPPTTTT